MVLTKYFAAFAPCAAAFNWKPGLSPRFDAFADSSVGPWSFVDEKLEHPVSSEVEEVMRSCGGAVQGIRELPNKFMLGDFDDEDAERSYHNRADGGFVFFDDGSYSAADTKCSSGSAGVPNGNSGVAMSSLSFPGNRRLWFNTKLPAFAENSSYDHVPASMLELSRNKPLVRSNRECNTEPIPFIQWSSILRARMPSPQRWSLARSKWEKTAVDAEPFRDDECTFDRPLLGWTYVNSVESGDPFSDTVSQGIVLHTLGICPKSRTALSIARCYGTNDGELKSVAYLQGLAVDELAG